MKHMLSLAFGVCLCWAVQAQNQDSLWTSHSMESEIEWLTLASDGTLLSGNTQVRDGATIGTDVYTIMTGIDAQTGKVKWKYPASSPRLSQRIGGVDFIPNTP